MGRRRRHKRRRKKESLESMHALPIEWISFGHHPDEVPHVLIPLEGGGEAKVWVSTLRPCQWMPEEDGDGGELRVEAGSTLLGRALQEGGAPFLEGSVDPFEAKTLGEASHILFAIGAGIQQGRSSVCWGLDALICDDHFVAITDTGLQLGVQWGLDYLHPSPQGRGAILLQIIAEMTGRSPSWAAKFMVENRDYWVKKYRRRLDELEASEEPMKPPPTSEPPLWASFSMGAGKTVWRGRDN